MHTDINQTQSGVLLLGKPSLPWIIVKTINVCKHVTFEHVVSVHLFSENIILHITDKAFTGFFCGWIAGGHHIVTHHIFLSSSAILSPIFVIHEHMLLCGFPCQ